jgi:hypothetical protein
VRVELLVVRGCPHELAASSVLAHAAEFAGVGDVAVSVTVIDTDDEAQARGFVGSPTFLVEGADPFAEPGAPAGLSCRHYRTTAGLAGVPDVAELRDALVRAGASRCSEAGGR